MGKNRIRIGFLGGGMMAQIGHLPFYLADPRVEVVGVAEERPSLQEALGEQLGRERIFPNREALLAHPGIDALIVSAPRPATGPLTLEALSAGKHVLVEKPMAHTVDQARRLVNAARENGLTYIVGYMKLHDPGVIAAKAQFDEILASGRLGRLLSVRFYDYSKSYAMPSPLHVRPRESRAERYPVWPLYPDWLAELHRGTYAWFLNAASHDVSLLRHFFSGSIEVVGAASPNDGAMSALLCAGDVPITMEVARTEAGRWLEGAEFLFERGRLMLSIVSPMAVDKVSEVTIDDLDQGLIGKKVETGSGWSFKRQATAFVDQLTGEGPAVASGEAALADMELAEAIWRCVEAT